MSIPIVTKDAVAPAVVLRAYRYALDPTAVAADQMRSHCGAARFAFNHMLSVVKANLDQRAAERSYGIAEADLTVPLGRLELRKAWNQIKDQVAPWWPENSKEAYAGGVANLASALSNWSVSRSGNAAVNLCGSHSSRVNGPDCRAGSVLASSGLSTLIAAMCAYRGSVWSEPTNRPAS